ncbi:MAG TPA: hypothetical protein DCZ59_04260, partial [Bacteroidetes bacterium]|nr:hypothetical protein [Bacteroidota bacterium]
MTFTRPLQRLALTLLAAVALSPLHAQEDKQSFLDWMITDHGQLEQLLQVHPEANLVSTIQRRTIDTALDVLKYENVK